MTNAAMSYVEKTDSGEAGAEVLECLPNIRWKTRKGMAREILQQAWRSPSTGKIVWKDVPTVA